MSQLVCILFFLASAFLFYFSSDKSVFCLLLGSFLTRFWEEYKSGQRKTSIEQILQLFITLAILSVLGSQTIPNFIAAPFVIFFNSGILVLLCITWWKSKKT